ncbi:MAG: phosphatase PAP2 family protein [Gemmatimonadales bacterium]
MVCERGLDLTAAPIATARAAPGWRLVDRMLAGYGLLVAVVAITRLQQPGMPLVLVAHLGVPLLAWLLASTPLTPFTRVLRGIYPVLLLTGLYSAIDVFNRFGAAPTWDRQIQAIDQAIFGMQPSRDWWRAHPSAFWSATLHAAYLSYYFIVAIPLIVFVAQRRNEATERYLNGLLATYLVCYIFYLFVPVAGPYYEFARPSGAFIANLPARMVYAALRGGSAFGAAFPSSHVAATVAAVIGTSRASPRFAMVLAVPTTLLAVGVVYCQMHYATDAAAGLVLGLGIALTVTARRDRHT